MRTDRIPKSLLTRQSICFLALGLFAAAVPLAVAQTASQVAEVTLPDSPGAVLTNNVDARDISSTSATSSFDPASSPQSARQMRMASHLDMVILPGQQAPTLSARDKFLMGAKDSVTPFSITSWFTAAGYSHLTDSSPNFGVDRGAFGERLGAAAIRGISEDIFCASVMANVLHEDPRYYQMGRSHSIGKRIVYAGTRVFVTRTDSGKMTPNLSLLTGTLASSILTNAYYPPRNHGAGQTMEIFVGSVGGTALGFGVTEFLGDALQILRLKKSE